MVCWTLYLLITAGFKKAVFVVVVVVAVIVSFSLSLFLNFSGIVDAEIKIPTALSPCKRLSLLKAWSRSD